jgi:sulfur-oxidizing protein SoxY
MRSGFFAAGAFSRWALLGCALLTLITVTVPAFAADEQQPASGAWDAIRKQLYETRDIGIANDSMMRLEVPGNTPDPVATSVTMRFGEAAHGRLKRVQLIIDNNPAPLAATFDLERDMPISEINLRVRIDRYTSVRAVAETVDGNLLMRSGWVKASGGCSAPSSAASGGTPGEMRFRPSEDGKSLQVSIRHPNHSGFQIDPRSGDPIPPHFVSSVRFEAEGKTLLTAQTGISVSENPSLRLASSQALPTPLTVYADDSENAHFSSTWAGMKVIESAKSSTVLQVPLSSETGPNPAH